MKKVLVLLALGDSISLRRSACVKAVLHLRSRFMDPVAAYPRREAVTLMTPLAAGVARRNSHSSGFDTYCTADPDHGQEVALCDGNLRSVAGEIYNGIKYSVMNTRPNLLPRSRSTNVPGRELPLAPLLKKVVAQLRQDYSGCAITLDNVHPLRSLIPKCWLPFAFS
jgi:hypothetical protein